MSHRLLVWGVRRAGWSAYTDEQQRALSVRAVSGAQALDAGGRPLAGGEGGPAYEFVELERVAAAGEDGSPPPG